MKPVEIKLTRTRESVNVSADPNAEPLMAEIDILTLSWELAPTEGDYRDPMQTAYRVIIYRNGENIYDTDRMDSLEQNARIVNPPEKLKKEDALILTLTLWDGDNYLTETVDVEL